MWRGTGGGQLIISSFGWQVFVLDLFCQPTVLSPLCILHTVLANFKFQEELAEPDAARGCMGVLLRFVPAMPKSARTWDTPRR